MGLNYVPDTLGILKIYQCPKQTTIPYPMELIFYRKICLDSSKYYTE